MELADRLGFDYAWEVEHRFLDEYSHSSAPEVFLAAAASRTKPIRLGHGIRQVIPKYNQLTADVLAHPEIVAIHDPAAAGRPAGWEQRFTTRRLRALETEIGDAIASGVESNTGAVASESVAVASTDASLGTDQHDAVTRPCTQGNAIKVLFGRAGTGKTYTLAAVFEIRHDRPLSR